jgi:hypothetical protein
MVFDETGERLTPTHAVKKGTRYRYYVSTSLVTGTEKTVHAARGAWETRLTSLLNLRAISANCVLARHVGSLCLAA